MVAATTSDGRHVDYAYDDHRRLVTATGPAGTRSYRWNDAGLIESVTDADGVVEAENTYDAQGRVTTQRSQFGRVTRFVYLPGQRHGRLRPRRHAAPTPGSTTTAAG